MGQQDLSSGAAELMKRIEDDNRAKSCQEIVIDNSNEVTFPGYPYGFRALNEKILVSIDVFKSGYECKTCQGKKRIQSHCSCEDHDRPGFKYSNEQLGYVSDSLGETVAAGRRETPCPECGGDYLNQRTDTECPECHGIGALLVLPDSSKNLPTTGVIVSMGKKAALELEREDIHLGDRVLFGAYAGTMVPTQAGLMFKYMDWYLAVMKISGAEGLAAFDFILTPEE
jgi:co-chaperonin GroES (HSP10)